MPLNKVATLLCLLLPFGCSGGDENALGGQPSPDECVAKQSNPPQWMNAPRASIEVRVVLQGTSEPDVLVQLKSQIDTYLVENNPQLGTQVRARVSELAVEFAGRDEWIDGDDCQTWTTAFVGKETISNEVVFLQLNRQLAQNIPHFRELGSDADRSMKSRSRYLATALLMLESLDSRYLSQTMAVNYERELIQSKLDELTETSAADFRLLLESALASTSVDTATRTRASIEKFASIDQVVLSDGLGKMDRLIESLLAQRVRAGVDKIRVDGLNAGYQQAEVALDLLVQRGEGSNSEQVAAAVEELNQHARAQRVQEIQRGLARFEASTTTVEALNSLLEIFADLERRYGLPSDLSDRRAVLESIQSQVTEVEALVAEQACSSIVQVTSYTDFEFSQTGSSYSERNRRLIIERTTSTVTLANSLDAAIQIVGVVQTIGSKKDGVIVKSSKIEVQDLAGGGGQSVVVDLIFDNEHPAAKACLETLVQRSYECGLEVVTSVSVARHYACPPATVSVTERVSLLSAHKTDNYTIKLLRNE